MRASLMQTYTENPNLEYLLISAPVDIEFEQQVLISVISLLQNLLKTRFKTPIEEDENILRKDRDGSEKLTYRKRVAVSFRLQQKRILASQIKLCQVLTIILSRLKPGVSIKESYMNKVETYESKDSDSEVMLTRLQVRKYLREIIVN